MSFDIEKRFRFVSSDDINDDINESHYQDDKIELGNEEEENSKKPRILKEESLEESDFKELEDEEEDEEDEEEDFA